MADLLRIRKGTHAGLEAITTKVPGTIYVTTDEKAMYVDISTTERIRLGQIIEVADQAAWATMKPPYSSEGFYYIVAQNALIKYTGDNVTHSWKQINAPTDLSGLTKRVSDLETAVGNNGTTKTGIYKLIADNTTAIGNNATAITGLDTRLDTAEDEIDTLQSEMDAVEQQASDNADSIDSLTVRVGANETAIGTNKTNIETINGKIGTAGAGQDGTIYELIASNKSAITSNDGDISKLNTTVYGTADGSSNTDSGLVNKVAANTSNISSLTSKVSGLETTVGNHTTSIGNLRADLGNKGDAASADSAFGRIAKNTADIATNTGNINKNTAAIATNTGNISKNTNAITGLTSRVGANETAIEGLDGRLVTAESNISTLQETVNGHTISIGTINTKIGEDTSDPNGEGSLYERIASVRTKAATNATNIGSNTNKITSIENLIGDSDDTGSNTIYGLINGKVDADDYATDKAALEKKINDEILAVNAMTYKGTTSVALASDKANTKIGDTYVASASFKQGQIDVNPGDLLIASGTEDTTGPNIGYISNITWQHVNTGYNQSHSDSLTGANNAISLTSYTGQNLGSVAFESKAVNGNTSALTVAVANNKVTLAVEWEDF